MAIKINRFEFENIKKIKAVELTPSSEGLTIVGGKNAQGKTTVLDAIAWTLGGNRFKPSEAQRENSVLPPNLKVELSNGLIVERSGKNSDLKVTDPRGEKAGQKLLDSFISELALDLPRFMESSSKEKANILLKIIGVEDELARLEKEEDRLYTERRATGQIRDKKFSFVEEMEYFPEVENDEPLSVSDLIQEQQKILAKNGRNNEIRKDLKELLYNQEKDEREYADIVLRIKELEDRKARLGSMINERKIHIENCSKTVEELVDESTAEIENSIKNIEELNYKISINQKKEEALIEAEGYAEEYDRLSVKIDEIRDSKKRLLDGADLPLPELSIDDGELTYKGFKWDGMSGSEKLKVATAIVRKLQPECGFVLIDKFEAFDKDELESFGKWAESEDLQIIATRVSNGDECTIIITDGYGDVVEKEVKTKKWEKGVF